MKMDQKSSGAHPRVSSTFHFPLLECSKNPMTALLSKITALAHFALSKSNI
jgi:hypothetical protein